MQGTTLTWAQEMQGASMELAMQEGAWNQKWAKEKRKKKNTYGADTDITKNGLGDLHSANDI